MIEREMEDLLWEHPEKLLNEPLERSQRQPTSGVGRADLVFRDRSGGLLVVEVKHGTLPRGAIEQVNDYFGMVKLQSPDQPVEKMVVANRIPPERKLACENHDITAVEIPERKFRKVAEEVGYNFKSEAARTSEPSNAELARPTESERPTWSGISPVSPTSKGWFHWKDSSGRGFFLAFVNARGSCSMRVFEEMSGAFRVKTPGPNESYEERFSEYLDSAVQLRVSRKPNLQDAEKHGLPSHTLSELRQQLGGLTAHESSNSAFEAAAEAERPTWSGISHVKSTSKGWFHWKDSSGRGYFLAFVNARGSCSMRVFEETSGAFRVKTPGPNESYEERFSEYLDSGVQLRVSRPPNLQDAEKHGLPSHTLSELRKQIS